MSRRYISEVLEDLQPSADFENGQGSRKDPADHTSRKPHDVIHWPPLSKITAFAGCDGVASLSDLATSGVTMNYHELPSVND